MKHSGDTANAVTKINLLNKVQSLLQIRRNNRDNSEIIFFSFFFLNENIGCELSLEPSWQDGSNESSQHMFLLKDKENYL